MCYGTMNIFYFFLNWLCLFLSCRKLPNGMLPFCVNKLIFTKIWLIVIFPSKLSSFHFVEYFAVLLLDIQQLPYLTFQGNRTCTHITKRKSTYRRMIPGVALTFRHGFCSSSCFGVPLPRASRLRCCEKRRNSRRSSSCKALQYRASLSCGGNWCRSCFIRWRSPTLFTYGTFASGMPLKYKWTCE